MDRPHSRVYVRLRPSKLDKKGVGVFAIRKIPKDTRIFADENEELCWIPKSSLPKGKALRTLYEAFAVIEGDRYGCPTSFNRLTPAWFLNESKKPNTRCDENYDFHTLRDVCGRRRTDSRLQYFQSLSREAKRSLTCSTSWFPWFVY